MKDTLVRAAVAVAFIISVIAAQAQRVIQRPDFECRKSHLITIDRITLGPDETRVDFVMAGKKGKKGTVGKNSALRDVATGEMYYPTRVEGIEFDKTIRVPEEGSLSYTLYYPALPESVKAVDFIEGSWDIFGLRLDGGKACKPARLGYGADRAVQQEHSPELPPLFSHGTFHIEGALDGYDPRLAGKNMQLRTFSASLGDDRMWAIEINADGTFSADIEVDGPHYAWLNGRPLFSAYLYVEPSESLYIYYDIDRAAENDKLGIKDKSHIRFGGTLGAVNEGLYKAPDDPYIYSRELMKDLSPEQMMAHIDSVNAVWGGKVEKYLADNPSTHPLAAKILRNDVKGHRAFSHLEYLMDVRMAENMAKSDSTVKVDTVTLDYYRNFLPELLLADTTEIVCRQMSILLNRLAYCSLPKLLGYDGRPVKVDEDMLNPQDKQLMLKRLRLDRKAELGYDGRPVKVGEEMLKRRDISLMFKRQKLDRQAELVCGFLGVNEAPLLWQMAETALWNNYDKTEPNAIWELARTEIEAVESITNPVLRSSILKHQESRYKSVPRPLPDTAGGCMMKRLTAPYEGKLIFVDFWATGCGPCRAEIEHNREFRDSHREGKDYVFMFITGDEESPESVYNQYVAKNLTNDITLRIPQDDFNLLRELFNFSGIPFHTVITPDGKVMDYNNRLSKEVMERLLAKMGIAL